MPNDSTRTPPHDRSRSPSPTGRGLSRRDLLRYGAGAVVLVGGVEWLTQTPSGRAFARDLRSFALTAGSPAPAGTAAHAPVTFHFPPGYFHAFFTVNSPEEATQAAVVGVNYTIQYGPTSAAAVDLTTTLGQTLARNGMKTFLNVENPFLSCANGSGVLDEQGVVQFVTRFKDSPLLAGYWTKDDDCGAEAAAVLRLHDLIRAIDPDPRHRIMPGFGDAASVARNYAHGQGDLLGFYPYPAYSRGPAVELPQMLAIVRARTPSGATPPPFVGIYQDFGNPPQRPVPSQSDILSQAQVYLDHGAIGLAGFGWEADIESHVPANDATLRLAVSAVSNILLKQR
jgi:hypothetical protein